MFILLNITTNMMMILFTLLIVSLTLFFLLSEHVLEYTLMSDDSG